MFEYEMQTIAKINLSFVVLLILGPVVLFYFSSMFAGFAQTTN